MFTVLLAFSYWSSFIRPPHSFTAVTKACLMDRNSWLDAYYESVHHENERIKI